MYGRFATVVVILGVLGASMVFLPGLVPGASAAPTSSVVRSLDGTPTCGENITVAMDITWSEAEILAVEESFPETWTIGEISNGGQSKEDGVVKWFLFDRSIEELTYELAIPTGTSGDASLSGTFRDDKMGSEESNAVIQGVDSMEVSCDPSLVGSVTRTVASEASCGDTITVELDVDPTAGTDAWILDEDAPIPPSDVDEEDHGDSVDGRVKWISTTGEGGLRTYDIEIPPDARDGTVYIFRGEYRFNPSMDDRARVTGDTQLTVSCGDQENTSGTGSTGSSSSDEALGSSSTAQRPLPEPTQTATAEISEASGGAQATFAAPVQAAAHEGVRIDVPDEVLVQVDLYPGEEVDGTFTIARWGWDGAPSIVGELPDGVEPGAFLELNLEGARSATGHTMLLHLQLPSLEVLDPEHALLLRWTEGGWEPIDRVYMELAEDGVYEGKVRAPCCSVFALAFDLTPPSLAVEHSDDGTAMTIVAEDNLGIQRAEVHDRFGVLATDTEAPFTFQLGDLGLAAGDHELTAMAFDHAGNPAETSAAVTVPGEEGGIGLAGYLLGAVLLGGAVGATVYLHPRIAQGRSLDEILPRASAWLSQLKAGRETEAPEAEAYEEVETGEEQPLDDPEVEEGEEGDALNQEAPDEESPQKETAEDDENLEEAAEEDAAPVEDKEELEASDPEAAGEEDAESGNGETEPRDDEPPEVATPEATDEGSAGAEEAGAAEHGKENGEEGTEGDAEGAGEATEQVEAFLHRLGG